MVKEDWNADLYDQKHAFVFKYGASLISILAPQAGETILDLGCGTGHLTRAIADAGAHVIGMDSSASMIESARIAYPGLDFQVGDATNFTPASPVDAIFSNATLHWIQNPAAAARHMAAALKPGGRLVAEFGGKGNIATITSATRQAAKEITGQDIQSSWYFPSIGEYTSLLEQYGLTVNSAILFERPTPLEGEDALRNWLNMFGLVIFQQLPEDIKQQVIIRAEALARPTLYQNGRWIGDYRRLRIVAYKDA
ncbi:class I SAM-dependent methyltransferase [Dictyobacter arantiisoli]|uniref:Methyltransferase type 11 n=1 Tax=Dictyobacter arantiisoli TaxID=2014874 RepID=A0A5A5THC0_9CHLR|nr:methyltransferase domain-containing protein [Dictyobacter arantiisoli]GCF10971.1 methyltransferase type 11 [Dictyobacter arantiisoli]